MSLLTFPIMILHLVLFKKTISRTPHMNPLSGPLQELVHRMRRFRGMLDLTTCLDDSDQVELFQRPVRLPSQRSPSSSSAVGGMQRYNAEGAINS